MAWFRSKQEQLLDNLYDEQVHAQVAGEIVGNNIWPGLWAKAFAQANGDEARAKAMYIKLRVEQIKLGVNAEGEMVQQAERSLTESARQHPKSPAVLEPEPQSISPNTLVGRGACQGSCRLIHAANGC